MKCPLGPGAVRVLTTASGAACPPKPIGWSFERVEGGAAARRVGLVGASVACFWPLVVVICVLLLRLHRCAGATGRIVRGVLRAAGRPGRAGRDRLPRTGGLLP